MPVTQLDGRVRTARMRLTNRVRQALAAMWVAQTGSPADEETQQQFAAQAAALVANAQRQQASTTAAYQTAKAREAGVRPSGRINPDDYVGLRGVDPQEVYRRPFGAVGHQLSRGAAFERAMRAGSSRLVKLSATDIQLAHTYASRDWMAGDPVVTGYRRVLGPGKNCGLCIVASTQRYHKQDLAPIHENCGCTVSPMYGGKPTVQVIDSNRLQTVESLLRRDDRPYTREAMSRLRIDADDLPDKVTMLRDPEIGQRLYNEAWG